MSLPILTTFESATQRWVRKASPPGGTRWLGVESIVFAYLVLVILVPANYTLRPALGSVGRPAVILGLGMLFLWVLTFVAPQAIALRPSRVRGPILVYFVCWNTSVGLAHLRGLSAAESSGMQRYYITTLSLCGVALFVAEMLPDRAALDRFVKRLVYCGAIMGVIGLLQFYAGINLVDRIRLPLPVYNEINTGLATRGSADLTRATSTAQHSIEFGVLSAMILAPAIHYALSVPAQSRDARRRWFLVALCTAGVPLSVARSGVIALIVALIVLFRAWQRSVRLRGLVVVAISTLVLRVTTPGLVGTILSFFRNAESDRSVEGRTDDYALVTALVEKRPWFGLGGGTFRPEAYFILDNYILNALVATGFVGLMSFLYLILGPYSVAVRTARTSSAPSTRHLGFALAASLLAALVCSLTFDSLNFPGVAGLLFVTIGMVGALRSDDVTDVAQDARFAGVVRPRRDLRPLLTRHVEHSS